MSDSERPRDPAIEERERLSFIVLQHLYSLADDEEADLMRIGRVASELALPTEDAVQIVAHLTYAGFLAWEGTGRPVRITAKGSGYIEELAHRRHSLRVWSPEVNV